jgi:hypothetical protein
VVVVFTVGAAAVVFTAAEAAAAAAAKFLRFSEVLSHPMGEGFFLLRTFYGISRAR